MTNDNDKLRRLRDVFTDALCKIILTDKPRMQIHPTDGVMISKLDLDKIVREVNAAAIAKIDRLLAEPEAQAPSDAAPPVTDAEVELDALLAALPDSVVYYDGFHVTDAWIERLRALIARRVQQAVAAAEELARAVDVVRNRLDLPGHAECTHPKECPWSEDHETLAMLDTAIAAFRAAQGGAS